MFRERMAMMGQKDRSFAVLPPVTLEELVPPDHFYRHLERSLDLNFVRGLVREAYADIGRPSIDPVVFFKLQLILFFEGLRSERQLMQVVADRLSLRVLSGVRPDRALARPLEPDPHPGALRAGGLPPLL
jgi:transposase